MEYIAVLEGLNGLQFTQQSSRKSVGSNSWKSAGGKAPGCVSCDYEASAECTYEAPAECGYEASASCEYEMSAPCEYTSYNCDAPCGDPIPAYVPPPQVFVPQIVPTPQQPVFQQPAPQALPMPEYVPVGMPTQPAVQYQLMPVALPVGVPQVVVPVDPNEGIMGLRGKLGRLGKIFGK